MSSPRVLGRQRMHHVQGQKKTKRQPTHSCCRSANSATSVKNRYYTESTRLVRCSTENTWGIKNCQIQLFATSHTKHSMFVCCSAHTRLTPQGTDAGNHTGFKLAEHPCSRAPRSANLFFRRPPDPPKNFLRKSSKRPFARTFRRTFKPTLSIPVSTHLEPAHESVLH